MSKQKVENTTYIKDTKSGVITNANTSEYLNAKARRSKQKKDKLKITNLQTELKTVKETMSELLQLVQELNNANK